MIIPIRTEVDVRRRAVVTPVLVLVNAAVMVAALVGLRAGWFDAATLLGFGALRRHGFEWWQPLTYQFLHDLGGVWHLLFNMLFLWVFGTAVEGRLGRIGFLAFYLVGGAFAGLVHLLFSPEPVIGASGAVAACSGAFLALFPRARVKLVVLFFIVGVWTVPAAWVIGFYFATDLLSQTTAMFGRSGRNVAYAAHLAGYAYGFIVAVALLATRVLPRGDFDIFFLFVQWRRRAAMRAAVRDGVGGAPPWSGPPRSPPPGIARALPPVDDPAAQRTAARRPAPERPRPAESTRDAGADAKVAELRREIAALVDRHDLPAAAQRYLDLVRLVPNAVIAEPRQLDVANQLLAEGRVQDAVQAYERFLSAFPSSYKSDDVRLLLASVYARRLSNGPKARSLLESLAGRLRNAQHAALAEQLLKELAA
ncbi:MAG: rhomboid family intramembrane serine protease [Phycisphaerales bacterium]